MYHVQSIEKKSLTNLGMYDTWLFNGNGFTPSYIKEAFKLRTKDIFIQEWYNDKNYHNYCGIYNVVKMIGNLNNI